MFVPHPDGDGRLSGATALLHKLAQSLTGRCIWPWWKQVTTSHKPPAPCIGRGRSIDPA